METVLRVTFIYVFLMIALRIIGKREFGQLAPFDLVVLLLIPELFQQALLRDDFSLTNAVVGVSTLFVLVFATSLVSYRSPRMSRILEGVPIVLVQHGQLVEPNLTRERISPEEVLAAVNRDGLEQLAQVKWAILGADGKISVIPWDRHGNL
ncbi:MAG: DUF421 domain-containing protein [Longimicrobiales bacterium]